ncbi:electron transport complex subunit RsxC [Alginatibacterium sediminis]|uniref:Ion-translocating oxidoreductase complex subunit C n=1 Tax=Alginatibacterium sediminis TaxID=2164068 RepID=A0A420EGW1_9ALTE|nr:electron transport complex subunit RsxC [Alginatibacterium sediminis]RKF19929.1 electron transport complex subunit RsxC [Alginatibacterium sediminis]
MNNWLENAKVGILHRFRGGVHPQTHKSNIDTSQVYQLTCSDECVVALQQHIGSPAKVIVAIGDTVLKGQALSQSLLFQSPPVHSPCSGVITAIEKRPSTHASGLDVMSVVITNDHQYNSVQAQPALSILDENVETIIQRIHDCGISGMGGAGFPTAIKINQSKDIDLLLINGAECEPYITADSSLMQNYANDIVSGVQIIKHCSTASLALIAIEDDKPKAIAAIRSALDAVKDPNIELRVVPTKYPSGGEKQLIQIVSGIEISAGMPPIAQGILVQNVGTAYSVFQAVVHGKPLIERVVTLAGDYVEQARNFWVPIGTSIESLLQQNGCPSPSQTLSRPIVGGAMMGFMLNDCQAPVTKTSNCILYNEAKVIKPAQACIRCGECAQVCPIGLLPQQLHWYSQSKDLEKAKQYQVMDCIECGACAFVCPSEIPLVQEYRETKAAIRLQVQAKLDAERAKMRHENRQQRLEQEKEARKKQHQLAAKRRQEAADSSDGDAVAAALARVKSQQQAKAKTLDNGELVPDNQAAIEARKAKKAERLAAKNTQQTSGDSQADLDPVAGAIARAKAKKQQANIESHVAKDPRPSKSQNPAVAAAIARAKAKKQQGNEEVQEPETSAPSTKQNPAVAAAIARAKAKKQQGNEEVQDPETSAPSTKQNPAVAAAIARAKAKKQQASAEVQETEASAPTTKQNPAIAAAIARAKAKKQQASAEVQETEASAPSTKQNPAVAAAIARAKAKKQQTSSDDQKPQPSKPKPIQNPAVAAAIARAKAKKQEKEAQND